MRTNPILKVLHFLTEPIHGTELERKINGFKNRLFLAIIASMMFLYAPVILVSKTISTGTHILNEIMFFSMFLSVLLFARRSGTALRIFLILMICMYGPVSFYFFNDVILYVALAVYMIPCFVNLVTNSPIYPILATALQIVFFNKLYKESLLTYIKYHDATAFTEDFTALSIFGAIQQTLLVSLITYNLRSTEKRLSHAEHEKQKQFLMSFSHELRNPMNSLMGNLQLAFLEENIYSIKELLNTAKVCGELMLHLVNNILDRGKLEVGELEANMIPIKFYEAMERIWIVCSESIKRKNLKGNLKISKKVPEMIKMDHHRLAQILLNLVGNAVKFTKQGLVSISIDWIEAKTEVTDECFFPMPYDEENEGVFEKEEEISGKLPLSEVNLFNHNAKHFLKSEIYERSPSNCPRFGVLKLVVRDTGVGIHKNQLDRIFSRYVQLQQDDETKKLGSGLGLAITQELCRKMGGAIRAFSRPGIGTTFIICLPTEIVFPTNDDSIHIEGPGPSPLANCRCVLVVDDSGFNIEIHVEYLKRLGITNIHRAENGQKAYELYERRVEENHPFSLVLMDLDMPIMDGKESTRRIRAYENDRKLPPSTIIIVSGNWDENDLKQCTDLNGDIMADYFLKKPLRIEDLKAIICPDRML